MRTYYRHKRKTQAKDHNFCCTSYSRLEPVIWNNYKLYHRRFKRHKLKNSQFNQCRNKWRILGKDLIRSWSRVTSLKHKIRIYLNSCRTSRINKNK